jgi:hypothetical protein
VFRSGFEHPQAVDHVSQPRYCRQYDGRISRSFTSRGKPDHKAARPSSPITERPSFFTPSVAAAIERRRPNWPASRRRPSRTGWAGVVNRTRPFSASCGRPKLALNRGWSRSSPGRRSPTGAGAGHSRAKVPAALGQGHSGGGTASPSDLQRRRHPPEGSRADRSRPRSSSASRCHHYQCRREPNQTTRSAAPEALGGIEPGRGQRVPPNIEGWAGDAERPPAEAAEPRLKIGLGPP